MVALQAAAAVLRLRSRKMTLYYFLTPAITHFIIYTQAKLPEEAEIRYFA